MLTADCVSPALLSTLCLHLHMLNHYDLLSVWYTPVILRRIIVFAAVILVAALALMAWYLSQIITKHQGLGAVTGPSGWEWGLLSLRSGNDNNSICFICVLFQQNAT